MIWGGSSHSAPLSLSWRPRGDTPHGGEPLTSQCLARLSMAVSPMADLNFSVCIEMLFTDLPLLARPAAVAAAGYSFIEFGHWSGKPMDDLQAAADAAGVELVCFHCEADVPLVNPETTAQWVADAQGSIAEARRRGVSTLIVATGQEIMGLPRAAQHAAIVAGLRGLAPLAEAAGITLVLETLNILC